MALIGPSCQAGSARLPVSPAASFTPCSTPVPLLYHQLSLYTACCELALRSDCTTGAPLTLATGSTTALLTACASILFVLPPGPLYGMPAVVRRPLPANVRFWTNNTGLVPAPVRSV